MNVSNAASVKVLVSHLESWIPLRPGKISSGITWHLSRLKKMVVRQQGETLTQKSSKSKNTSNSKFKQANQILLYKYSLKICAITTDWTARKIWGIWASQSWCVTSTVEELIKGPRKYHVKIIDSIGVSKRVQPQLTGIRYLSIIQKSHMLPAASVHNDTKYDMHEAIHRFAHTASLTTIEKSIIYHR